MSAAHADEFSSLSQMAEVIRIGLSRPLRGLIALSLVSLAASLVLRGLWAGPWLMQVKGLSRIELATNWPCHAGADRRAALHGDRRQEVRRRRAIVAAAHFMSALLSNLGWRPARRIFQCRICSA